MEETQLHVKKKNNDIDSPKLGGGGGDGAPIASKLWGQVPPMPPSPGGPAPASLDTDAIQQR